MRRALPVQIALIALFLTACSTGTPPSGGALDGPMTTITIATAERGIAASGVPFDGNEPVVTAVSVSVRAVTIPNPPVALRFSLVGGVYTYDPDGDLTSLDFAFTDGVIVTLPVDETYEFAARGEDFEATWMAYGVTMESVDDATESVRLALQTVIDEVTLDVAPSLELNAIAANQTVDLFLRVTSPGRYDVPTSDYAVAYDIAAVDGSVVASSKLGAQVRAHAAPSDGFFTVTASVAGWRIVDGLPVWVEPIGGFDAMFEVAFPSEVGFGFDAVAPVVSIMAPSSGNVGSPLVLSGTASDAGGLDRVQVFVGPVLIASSDVSDVVDGVTLLELVSGAWAFDWTPSVVRSHTFTALAIDAAGNERSSSAVVDVEAAVPLRTLTFVLYETAHANVAAGENVILSGPVPDGFDVTFMAVTVHRMTGPYQLDLADLVVADGVWTLPWTVDVGVSDIDYYYDVGVIFEYAWIFFN